MIRYILVTVLILALVALALLPFAVHTYRATTTRTCAFVVNCDFETARKIMVRTDAGDRMVAACNGRVISKQVGSLDVSTDKILKGMRGNWEVNAKTNYMVEAPNPRGGLVVLPLEQVSCVHPNHLVSVTKLLQPAGNFRGQETHVDIQPYAGATYVTITLFLDIGFTAPYWPSGQKELEKQIVEGADAALSKMQTALIKTVGERKGQKLSLKII